MMHSATLQPISSDQNATSQQNGDSQLVAGVEIADLKQSDVSDVHVVAPGRQTEVSDSALPVRSFVNRNVEPDDSWERNHRNDNYISLLLTSPKPEDAVDQPSPNFQQNRQT